MRFSLRLPFHLNVVWVLWALIPAVISWIFIKLADLQTLERLLRWNRPSLNYKTKETNAIHIFHSVNCGAHVLDITDRKCAKRLFYLRDVERHPCFLNFGVPRKANECALLRYLAFTERICPESLGLNASYDNETIKPKGDLLQSGDLRKAKWRTDMDGLILLMQECGEVCRWIMGRIRSSSDSWSAAIKELFSIPVKRDRYQERRKLTIILHMGLLSKNIGLDFGRRAFSGGPLGELVQWADLAAALHILGHKIILSWSDERLKEVMSERSHSFNDCRRAVKADLVFIDIYGLQQMKRVLGSIHHYRCRLRILDVFGTEPEFNHPRYTDSYTGRKGWGGIGVDPRQFFTQFPHTPDNSFLGFSVRRSTTKNTKTKRDKCLIYGKQLRHLAGMPGLKFLETLRRYFPDMHATMAVNEIGKDAHGLPSYIINHGPLRQKDFFELLTTARLYVGIGQPYEGPAPLEAIANGVVFLNPKFSPPISAHKGKPTNRTLSSQHPYSEMFIGAPYVFTSNIAGNELEDALRTIKRSKANDPKVTFEFTHLGFLEIQTSDPGDSCTKTCRKHDMTCERTHFPFINHKMKLQKHGYKCSTVKEIGRLLQHVDAVEDICHAPSFDHKSGSCFIQSDPLLFSCSCKPARLLVRLCPCREYKKENIAMCLECE